MLPFVRLPKESSTTTKAAEAAETSTQTGASSGAGMFSLFKKPQQVVEAIVPVPGTAAGAGARSRKLLPGRPMPHIMLSTVQVRHSHVAGPAAGLAATLCQGSKSDKDACVAATAGCLQPFAPCQAACSTDYSNNC